MIVKNSLRRQRKTKIVATLGPASSSLAGIRSLFEAGVDVFRLNFSHGSHADHHARYLIIRDLEQEYQRPIAVLQDLQGPKLRVGDFLNGREKLDAGQVFRFDLATDFGTNTRVSLLHPEIFDALQPGDDLLVDDGKLRFRVQECGKDFADTKLLNAGVISDRKGVNIPGAILSLSVLTSKDKEDLAFGLALGVDWVALSFVQRVEDIDELKEIVGTRAAVMAKIEKPSAIQSLEAIVEAADGIMVARGDLGVEMEPEDVPRLQEKIVNACRRAGKPVVVATQMLESMISAPIPTRAEVSDVATAVHEGADAVMLSAESASGAYPVEAVTMMSRIIVSAETDQIQQARSSPDNGRTPPNPNDAICRAICAAICTMAYTLPLAATVSYTTSGSTTLRVAAERPNTPILSLTPDIAVARMLALVWGVHSVCSSDAQNVEDMISKALQRAEIEGFSLPNHPLLIVAGTPFGHSGTTNLIKVVWPESAANLLDTEVSNITQNIVNDAVPSM